MWREDAGEGRSGCYLPFWSWCLEGRQVRANGTWGPFGVFSLDFHEVWPTEVETERQDRGKRQTELGRRRDGVHADSRVHLVRCGIGTAVCVVFAAATARSICHGDLSLETSCLLPLHPQTTVYATSTSPDPPLCQSEGQCKCERRSRKLPTSSFRYDSAMPPWPRKTKRRAAFVQHCPVRPFSLPPSLTRSQNSKGWQLTSWWAAWPIETKELFAARPQVVAVDINDLGTIKLNLEITW